MEDRRDARLATNDPAGSGPLRPSRAPSQAGRPAREPLPTRVQELPQLPAEYHRTLHDGLAHLELELDQAQLAGIDSHVRLLLAWTQAVNLTAIVDPAEVATRHVLDSLTAVDLLRRRGVDRLLDLGSGGGFPGLPLAVAVPLRHVLLVESTAKKAAFLAAAADALVAMGVVSLAEVAATRAEALAAEPGQRHGWPAVAARAVGPLSDLVELAFPFLAPGGFLVAWKRGDIGAEVSAARRAMAALGGGDLELVAVTLPALAGHRLVVATPAGTVPPDYPRDPRQRKRRPW